MFRSEWWLPGVAPDRVYAALADVETYPQWWSQVRGGRRIDADSGQVRCRSLLPYELCFVVRRHIEDPAARVLAAQLDGDLVGTSRWTIVPRITAHGRGSAAVFDEDVRVAKALVRLAGRVARPVLRLNHELMMRAGEAGLRRHLAAVADTGA